MPVREEHRLARSATARDALKILVRLLKKHLRLNPIKAVADRVGCSAQQIRNVLKGVCQPSWAVYCALCEEMGVDPVKGVREVLE